ncbi:flavin reductase family protein [Rhodococcus rhodochrous]|uniref:flavin reductase family protein n=1 Tax=Rhodococcus rhodochrous TaxID=1829 RepID=UPI001E4557D4|nr:flavin reductase family protein [Rhodococcus rhodochrous]
MSTALKVAAPIEASDLRRVFGCFPSGVTAVCTLVDGEPVGLAASSFTSVSLDPPLVSVCLQHSSRTLPLLRHADRVGVTILSHDQDGICRTLAGAENRFAGVEWVSGEGGAVFVEDGTAWFECSVYEEFSAGDHTILVLQVYATGMDTSSDPLVFHSSRFRRLSS